MDNGEYARQIAQVMALAEVVRGMELEDMLEYMSRLETKRMDEKEIQIIRLGKRFVSAA